MIRPIHEVMNAAARTPDTERAAWLGRTPRAKFQGAAAHDRATKARRTFGRRNTKG
jgi:hypothetical protein